MDEIKIKGKSKRKGREKEVSTVPKYQKKLILLMMVVLISAFFLICQPGNSSAQGSVSQDHKCLSCHHGILDHLPKYVHKPFAEEKCYHCHQFQFPAQRNHRFNFNNLAPENTYYFRIKEFTDEAADLTESENQALFVSDIYSFVPPTLGGVAINFSDSEDISRMELSTSGWNTSTAFLSWGTQREGYCIVEFDIIDSLTQAKAGHATNDRANDAYLKEIGITACYQCHPKEDLGISHPVNIYPSEKVREKMGKADLPTGKNGLLLCITCHLPHASDKKYLGQRLVAEELCVACHPKEIYNQE